MVVRAKVTNEPGTWPAIWTLGTSCDWPSNGEVDVMENYGGKILAILHGEPISRGRLMGQRAASSG